MRTIGATLFMSLDGVVESPERWAFDYSNDEKEEANTSGMAALDAVLLGRVTYRESADSWSNRPSGEPIAVYLNNVPKFVVSTTLDRVGWRNSTLIGGNVAEELAELKRQPGKDITIVGSPTLTRSLLRHGLLDELHLLVPPIVLGSGKRFFADEGEQKRLKLVDAKTFETGVLSLTYQPAGA